MQDCLSQTGMYQFYFLLDDQGNPYPTDDARAASQLLSDVEKRRIGETFFGAIRVSTVFLVFNHGAHDEQPVLYETMVFADESTLKRLMELSETDDRSILAKFFGDFDIQKRYATRAEAIEGHKNMCTFIEVCLAKNLLDGSQRKAE